MTDDDNLIPFPVPPHLRKKNEIEAQLDEIPVRPKKRDYMKPPPCRHNRSTVSKEERTVHCRDCGVPLDALDVLASLAWEYERWAQQLVQLRVDVKSLSETLVDLQRQERNAKARVRAARQKIPV